MSAHCLICSLLFFGPASTSQMPVHLECIPELGRRARAGELPANELTPVVKETSDPEEPETRVRVRDGSVGKRPCPICGYPTGTKTKVCPGCDYVLRAPKFSKGVACSVC